ncbi:dienelactone hydrolase family protein [Oleiharenicola lentus]|uniref:dienelactone hydrolase family protein n=1 Tax=Oleiharenicola lentus TaxID=2508720 RepID=UPI003F67D3B5
MKLSRYALVLTAVFAAVSAHAKIVSQAVAYDQGGVKLESWIVYDDAKVSAAKPAPGVLVVPEWWGLTDFAKGRATQLAKLGYVAFAVDMYGGGVTTRDKKKATELSAPFHGTSLMVDRTQAALAQLLASGFVDAKRVAAIGYCFGGTAVQLLAYSGAPLAGMVSFHGNLVPASAEAIAKNKARFLICHGAADEFVSAGEIAAFTKSVNDGKFDYQFVSYSGATHAFTNPEADKLGAENQLPVRYNEAADKRSWAHLKLFLKEIFAETKS